MAAEVIALKHRAAALAEKRERLFTLHAFGDASRPMCPAIVRIVSTSAASLASVRMSRTNERSIFDLIHRQALEIGEGRVAGPEVVDREAHTEALENLDLLDGPSTSCSRMLSGHLQCQPGGIGGTVDQRLLYPGHEIRLPELQ